MQRLTSDLWWKLIRFNIYNVCIRCLLVIQYYRTSRVLCGCPTQSSYSCVVARHAITTQSALLFGQHSTAPVPARATTNSRACPTPWQCLLLLSAMCCERAWPTLLYSLLLHAWVVRADQQPALSPMLSLLPFPSTSVYPARPTQPTDNPEYILLLNLSSTVLKIKDHNIEVDCTS